jgi:ribosome-binding ATPase
LRISLVGTPGCGRTTLFRALAGSASADPSKPLTVQVPDPRLDFLASVWNPKKTVRASVVFSDTMSPAFSPRALSELRDSTALALVLDNFASGRVERDFAACEAELILADLSVVEKRLERLVKESKAKSQEFRALELSKSVLEQERPLRTASIPADEIVLLSPFALLSLKPLFAISNRSSEPVSAEDELETLAGGHGAMMIPVNALFELELADIPEADRPEFLTSMGYAGSSLSRLLAAAYSSLDLISFLTMGADEVRAWPVRRGATAVEAAGTIHSDLARGFIRAQVIAYEHYEACTDTSKLREQGQLRLEGKDYAVRDGDILEIRFSV